MCEQIEVKYTLWSQGKHTSKCWWKDGTINYNRKTGNNIKLVKQWQLKEKKLTFKEHHSFVKKRKYSVTKTKQ